MGIDDLLGDKTPAVPRLTPRAPLSLKELILIGSLLALVWAAYDRLNKFAEKSTVEDIARAQTKMLLDMNHGFDTLGPKVDGLVDAQKRAELEKLQQKHKP